MSRNYPNETYFCEIFPELARQYEQRYFNDSLVISIRNVKFENGDNDGNHDDVIISDKNSKCSAIFENIVAIRQLKMNRNEEVIFAECDGEETDSCPINDENPNIAKQLNAHLITDKQTMYTPDDSSFFPSKLLNFEFPELINDIREVLNLEKSEKLIKVYDDSNNIYLHVNLPKTQQTSRSILFELAGLMYHFSINDKEKKIRKIRRLRFPFVHFGDIRIVIMSSGKCVKFFNCFGSLNGWIEGINCDDDKIDDTCESDEIFRSIESLNISNSKKGNSKAYESSEKSENDLPMNPIITRIHTGMLEILQDSMNLRKNDKIEDILSIPLPYLGVDSLRKAEFEYYLMEKWPVCSKLGDAFLLKVQTLEETAKLLSTMIDLEYLDSLGDQKQHQPIEQKLKINPTTSYRIPLSSQQKRLLFVSEVTENNSQFNEVVRIKLTSKNISMESIGDFLKKSLNILIMRHSILRTEYCENVCGQFLVSATECFVFPSRRSKHDQSTYNTGKVIPISCYLEKNVVVLIFNHIAIDGRSLSIFYKDFQFLCDYPNFELPRNTNLQYFNYCREPPEDCSSSESYWKSILIDDKIDEEVELFPTDFPRNNEFSGLERSKTHRVPQRILQKFDNICRKHQLSRFELFVSLLQIMIQKVFGVSNFNLGYAVDLRTQRYSNTMGCFTNLLPLRSTKIEQFPDLEQFLKDVQNKVQEGRKHGRVPYEKIVKIARQESEENPQNWNRELFQVLVVSDRVDHLDLESEKIQNSTKKPKTVRFEDENMRMTFLTSKECKQDCIRNIAKYDQTWYLRSSKNSKNSKNESDDYSDGIENEMENMAIEVQYDESIYKKSTIRFLINYLLRIINQEDAFNVSNHFDSFPVKVSDYPKSIIPQMVDKLKLCYMDRKEVISFSNSSQELAKFIFSKSIRHYGQLSSDSPLIVRLKRTPFLIKTIFATWNAGLYPIPINVDSTDVTIGKILKQIGTNVIVFDGENEGNIRFSRLRLFNRHSLFDLAYVTCTSGSTGEPKLVGTAFEGHSNLAVQYTKTFQLSERDVVCQVVDPSFDIFFADISKCSMNNCCLLLCRDQICSPSELDQSTNAYLMPAFLSRLPSFDLLSNLQTLQFGGESLPFRVIQNILLKSPQIRIWQEFGLTEQTVYTARNRIKGSCEQEMRQIGEAYENMKITIWDKERNIAPEICLKGQLVLEGCGLMRGYFGNQTSILYNVDGKPRFVTGDEVSVDDNGKITFIGRKDSQIKIRGFRIDLFEIESVAMSCGEIESCVCIGIDNQIIMFYKGNILVEDLKVFLETELISYKVPSEIVLLAEFPITRTGKIDRRKLKTSFIRDSITIPKSINTPEEPNKIAFQFKEFLEKYSDSQIPSDDSDIFAAGVDSIAIMLTIQKMRESGVELNAKSFFKLRTIKKILSNIGMGGESKEIDGLNKIEETAKTKKDSQLFIELNHIQQRILFLSRFMDSSDIFRLNFSFPLQSISIKHLRSSVNFVILGNRLLRSEISRNSSSDHRFIVRSATECFYQISYDSQMTKRRNLRMENGMETIIWLEKDKLQLSIHHIICDARSLQILKTQLKTLIDKTGKEIEFENNFNMSSESCTVPDAMKPDASVRILYPNFVPGSELSKYFASLDDIQSSHQDLDVPIAHLVCFIYALSIFEIFFSSESGKDTNFNIPIALTFANRRPNNWNTVSMFANTLPVYFNPRNSSAESISSKIYEINSNSNVSLKDVVSQPGPFSDFAINFHNSDKVENDLEFEKDGLAQFPLTLTYYQKSGTFIFGFDPEVIKLEKVKKLWENMRKKLVPALNEGEKIFRIFREILDIEVNVNTNFFFSGGHSLTAMRLIDQINEEMKIDLPIRTIFDNPTVGDMIGVIARLNDNPRKESNMRNVSDESKDSFRFPLCAQQLQMFYLSQLTSDSTEYQLPFIQPFPDSVSVHQIHHALLHTIQHQSIFRTIFRISETTGEPYQQVVSITESYIFCNVETVRNEELHGRVRQLCEEPIEVIRENENSARPLIRAVFLKSPEKNVAFLHLHHLISDARSTQITNNTMRNYLKHGTEKKERRPPKTSSYAYYCQNEQKMENPLINPEYIKSICEGVRKPLKPVKAIELQKSICYSEFIEVPSSQLCSMNSDTPFSLFLRCMSSVLCDFFDIPSINISFPVLNRNEKTANICGYFLNNLIIKMPSTQISLNSVIQSNYPYSQIVNNVRAKCGNTNPISEVYLNCRYDLEYDETDEEELLNLIPSKLHFPIEIDVDLFKDVFRVTMRSNIIQRQDIRVLLTKIKRLAENQNRKETLSNGKIVRTDDSILSSEVNNDDEPVTGSTSETDLNSMVFGSRRDIPHHSLPVLVSAFFRSSPSSIFAVQGADSSKSRNYQKSWSHILSTSKSLTNSVLVTRGSMLRSDDLIAIISSKSIDTTLLCLSVQLAGGAYLPIDETYPENAILKKIESSGAIGYISSRTYSCFENSKLAKLDLSRPTRVAAGFLSRSSAYDLSYVITTSGTTGSPKSVCISGLSVSNLAVSSTITMNCSSNSSIFQFTNFVFDNSVLEVVMAISNQARLIYEKPSLDAHFDVSSFEKMIVSPGISHCLLFPSLVQSMQITKLENLAYWIVGGERLAQTLLESSLQMGCHVIQNYGPTETTAFAVSRRMRIGDKSTNVGIPANNTVVWLNEEGELYIRGRGMMRGYWGGNKKNFRNKNGKEWYGSGDICELTKDENGMKNVIFKGRTDSQIKIRGFRVELLEIEKCVESHPNVSTCKTIFDPEAQNILAFFTSTSSISASDIRQHCSLKLENHKIPSFFENLKEFPLTKNSKIDMEQLKKWPKRGNENINPAKPKNSKGDVSERIAAIWVSLLNHDHPLHRNSSDHFFLIGGHSLLLIRLRHLIQTEFGIILNVPDLLSNLKFSDLVHFIENRMNPESAEIMEKHEELFVFFPALYGGCTTYLKAGNMLKNMKPKATILYLEEEFGQSVEEVARKYKIQISQKCSESTKLVFIGASAAGTFAFATSLIYKSGGYLSIDVVLMDTGTYWDLIEKLNYENHEKEISENLKSYTSNEDTIQSFIKSSWQTLQLLRKYDPSNSSKTNSDLKIHVLSIDGSDLGWRKIIKKFSNSSLEVYQIEGDHYTMLQDDQHVRTIVNILTQLDNSYVETKLFPNFSSNKQF